MRCCRLYFVAAFYALLVVYSATAVKAPKIQPFTFPTTLNAGERTATICVVTAGDKPLTFTWFKDGKTLETDDNVKITSNAEFSNLNFGSLAVKHSG
ncbi:unnamed protein product, partial [Ixodes pacificus]